MPKFDTPALPKGWRIEWRKVGGDLRWYFSVYGADGGKRFDGMPDATMWPNGDAIADAVWQRWHNENIGKGV